MIAHKVILALYVLLWLVNLYVWFRAIAAAATIATGLLVLRSLRKGEAVALPDGVTREALAEYTRRCVYGHCLARFVGWAAVAVALTWALLAG